jgi:hypothetical protein
MPTYDPAYNYKENLYGTNVRYTRPGKLYYAVCPDKDPVKATHVILYGSVFPYKKKAPFTMSGRSISGGLEYNKEKDLIKCHICGKWFSALGSHLIRTEGVSLSEYKTTHGLMQKTPLMAPRAHATRSAIAAKVIQKHGPVSREFLKRGGAASVKARAGRAMKQSAALRTMEYRNLRKLCPVQLRATLLALAEKLGRVPTKAEMMEAGLHHSAVEVSLGKSMRKVWKSFGWVPRNIGANGKSLATPRSL